MDINNLTKEQAIAKHRKMWNWIADQLEKAEVRGRLGCNLHDLKREYIRVVKDEEEYIPHDCYCCAYAKKIAIIVLFFGDVKIQKKVISAKEV